MYCVALVDAFVTSRLNYCNSLRTCRRQQGTFEQTGVGTAFGGSSCHGKMEVRPDHRRHMAPRVPVRQRIDFKLGVLVFKCFRGDALSYLVESVSSVADQPNLRSHRSATRGDLKVPRTRTVKMGARRFNVSGLTLWNLLPLRSYFRICQDRTNI